MNSLSIENEALLPGDSTHTLYCSEVHFLKSTAMAVWATSEGLVLRAAVWASDGIPSWLPMSHPLMDTMKF